MYYENNQIPCCFWRHWIHLLCDCCTNKFWINTLFAMFLIILINHSNCMICILVIYCIYCVFYNKSTFSNDKKAETVVKRHFEKQHFWKVWKICDKGLFSVKLLTLNLEPFHATGFFPYTLKTSDNQRLFDVFRGYKRRPVAWNGLEL